MNTPSPSRSGRVTVGRWHPFPEKKPEADKDGRHLVVLAQGDMHWIGIRYFEHATGRWLRTSQDHNEQVYWFTPLLADGEQCPSVPTAAEQAADPDNHYHLAAERTLR